MIVQSRSSRQGAQVARSNLAVRLGLAVYAATCAVVFLRCAVLILGFPDSVWSVDAVLTLSSPMVYLLSAIPSSHRLILGSATLSDLTAALLLLVAPLPFFTKRFSA